MASVERKLHQAESNVGQDKYLESKDIEGHCTYGNDKEESVTERVEEDPFETSDDQDQDYDPNEEFT
ncbi:unnamed protein product [Acanthoscelides obtectus]|uniref:Uncharacterized protein n=1 Tax=Acanthoscelides obtectus TaxID=200917 RepID=A0A9P0PBC6_ACAOB|nr:unnamed protein product [Acanthoscelides obtectus]CAK1628651.1 hypothetical protein AOBTE_LOCUS5327 [Acanthoscelides obtectus]